MINPVLTSFISTTIRPNSEKFRATYYLGIDITSTSTAEIIPLMVSLGLVTFDVSTGITPVVGQENELIDDGRSAQGIVPLKNHELCTLMNSFMSITASIASDQSLVNAMSNACVRPIELM